MKLLTKLQVLNTIGTIFILFLGSLGCLFFGIIEIMNAVEIDRVHPVDAVFPTIVGICLLGSSFGLISLVIYFAKDLIGMKSRKAVFMLKLQEGKLVAEPYDPILDAIGEDED